MGFWKIMGGIALGVGAVAAAPFTGGGSILGAASLAASLAGAGTVATAVGAGVVGAVAGAAMGDDPDEIEREKKRAREEGVKAGEACATEKYEMKLRELLNRLHSYHNFDEKLVGLYAIGLAIANADGDISHDEIDEIDGFVAGCVSGNLPEHIKETIQQLKKSPPSLESAIEFARKSRLAKIDIDDVISIVAEADNNISYSEQVFIDRWNSMSNSYAVS